jgi:hypothetical protein
MSVGNDRLHILFSLLDLGTWEIWVGLVRCHVYQWVQTGFGLVYRFIDHSHVVTTSNYNTIAAFRTTNHATLKSSQSTSTSLYLVAHGNGYSSAVSSLDVSWWRIFAMEILQVLLSAG